MDARIKLTEYQRNILNALLDSYESSSMTSLEQFRHRPPAIKPSAAVRNYDATSCPIDVIEDFHRDAELLEQYGDIMLVWENRGYTLKKMKLNIDHLDEVYRILGRKKKDDGLSDYAEVYRRFSESTEEPVIRQYCLEQIAAVNEGKKPQKSPDEIVIFLIALQEVLRNKEEVYERIFSIKLFDIPEFQAACARVGVKSATKLFGSLKSGIVKVLEKYGNYADITEHAETESEKINMILCSHMIVPNMSMVLIKGNGLLIFDNGDSIRLHAEEITPVYSRKLDHLVLAKTKAHRVITVENKTNFLMMNKDDSFVVFVSGYHKSGQQKLIQSIHSNNNHVSQWLHFGDLDPWGFDILEKLKTRTKVPFEPWQMGESEYLDDAYANVRLPLTSKDIAKLHNMIEAGSEYSNMLCLMEKHGYKLEQEKISQIVK